MVNCKSILFLLACLLIVSCSDNAGLPSSLSKPVEIRVSTGFGTATATSRSVGSVHSWDILNGSPLDLSVVRIDQTSDDVAAFLPYTSSNTLVGEETVGQAPRNGSLSGDDNRICLAFDSPESYLQRSANNWTKLIGWHPRVGASGSSWNVDNGIATVSFSIDGETDVLLSNLVGGSLNSPFDGSDGEDNIPTFNHLLTRFTIRVFSADEDVNDIWGGITGVSLSGKGQTCTVQLPGVESASNTFVSASDITFEGNNALPIIYKDPATNEPVGDYDEETGLPIPVITPATDDDGILIGTALLGYAMVAPEYTKLTLAVTTEKRTLPALEVPLPKDGFVAGTSYILTLDFMDMEIRVSQVSIAGWGNGNEEPEVVEVN